MKRTLQLLWKALLTLLLILVVSMLLFPLFFRDKIAGEIKTAINERVTGSVDYGAIRLNLFSSFPKLKVSISDLELGGVPLQGTQENLFYAKRLSFDLDLMSALRANDSIMVNSFVLDEPVVHVIRDGHRANYDISVQGLEGENSAKSRFFFKLKNYKIHRGQFYYRDLQSGQKVVSLDVDHTGSFVLEDGISHWKSMSKSPSLTIANKTWTWLRDADASWDMDLVLSDNGQHIKLKENRLTVNGLRLDIQGNIRQISDAHNLDIELRSSDADFKSLLSILPNFYNATFQNLNASGSFALTGEVNGILNLSKNTFPNYELDIDVRDGAFSFPDKKASFEAINLEAHISNQQGGGLDVMDVPKLFFRLNDRELAGRFLLRDMQSDPEYVVELRGDIDLSDLAEAYPLKNVDTISGLIDVDFDVSGKLSKSKQAEYQGTILSKNLVLEINQQPRIEWTKLDAGLMNGEIVLNQIEGKIGRSDFKGKGVIQQFEAIFGGDQALTIRANIHGSRLDINEWLKTDSVEAIPQKDWRRDMVMHIQADYDRVDYQDYDIKDMRMSVQGNLSRLKIEDLEANIQNSPMRIRGVLDSVYAYNYLDGLLRGDLRVRAESIRLEDWMVRDLATDAEPAVYVVVPNRFNFGIQLESDSIFYAGVKINNAKGNIAFDDGAVFLKNFKGYSLGGTFNVAGMYAYDGTDKAVFDLKYNLSNLSFEKTFKNVKSIKSLAPVGKYLEGVFNSDMILSGKLDPNYIPEFRSLTGSGFVETLHGLVKKFGPIDQLADRLNLQALKKIKLDYTRNWFDIKDGYVELEPWEKDIEGIRVKIGGKHQILGDMDYRIRLEVPSEKLDLDKVPKELRAQWDEMISKLDRLGIDAPKVDTIILGVQLLGTINHPDTRISILNLKSKTAKEILDEIIEDKKNELRDTVDQKIEEIKEEVRDTVEQLVEELKDTIQDIVDQAKDSVELIIDEKKEEIKDTIKSKIDDIVTGRIDSNLLDTLGGILDDIFDEYPIDIFGGKKQKDKKSDIKDRLKDWNPFGKKD